MMASAGGNVEVGLSVTSSHIEVVQTPAERAREKRLRDDPMAEVLGPLFVACKRCGNRIKLSPKSTYDPFHWQKHRERCLKKPIGSVKPRKRASQDNPPVSAKKPPVSSSKIAIGSATPPLTPDDEEDAGGQSRVKEESPSPSLNESSAKLVTAHRPPDLAFEDYLFRSRRKTTRELTPPNPDGWQTWSWSQLKPPVWVVASYPEYAEDDDDHTNDDKDSQDQPSHPSATLSLLKEHLP